MLDLLADERTFSESYVKLSDAQELALQALNIGKPSRAEIIKKARLQAAATIAVAADVRGAFLLNEIRVINED